MTTPRISLTGQCLLLALLCLLSVTLPVADAGSSFFVNSNGVVLDAPLQVQSVPDVAVRFAEIAAALTAQQQEIDELRARGDALEATTTRLESNLTTTLSRLAAATTQIDSLTTQLAEATTTILAQGKEIQSISGNLTHVQTSIDSQAQQLIDVSGTVREVINSTSSNSAVMFNELQADLASLTALIVDVQAAESMDRLLIGNLSTRYVSVQQQLLSTEEFLVQELASLASRQVSTTEVLNVTQLYGAFQTVSASSTETITARNTWITPTNINPLTISLAGSYELHAVFQMGAPYPTTTGFSTNDLGWSFSLTRNTTTSSSPEQLQVGFSSPAYGDTHGLAVGDNTRAVHWVGELAAGDVVYLQYRVLSIDPTDDSVAWSIWGTSNGGQRLSSVYLRPITE